MTESGELPKINVDEIRQEIADLIQSRGLTQAAVAREADLSSAMLSRFLAGRYEGDNETVAAKLVAWKESRAKRDTASSVLTQSHRFVSTSVSEKIRWGLEYAQLAADLVAIIGEPGVGKTETLEAFRRTGSSVWMATMSADTSGQVPMLEELGAAMGLNGSGGAAAMRRQIVGRVRNTNGLIMVDEAQHLDFKAIEALRGIYDAGRIGMVLCGNPKLMAKIGQLPQVSSRIGKKIILRKPARNDVLAVAEQFGITGKDERNFLVTISQHPGGLRCVVKTIRLASMLADGEQLAVNHMVMAWSELALEDQA